MGLLNRIKTEYTYLRGSLGLLGRLKPVANDTSHVFPVLMEQIASRFGDKVALFSDKESLTFRQFNERANQYARWAKSIGINKGDAVALLMHNRPEFVACWLGIIRSGGVVALLNTNLTGASLAHCINIAKPGHIITTGVLVAARHSADEFLDPGVKTWVYDAGDHQVFDYDDLNKALDSHSGAPLSGGEKVELTTADRALFIYTSGTTGLPKAANINHYRVQAIANGFSGALHMSERDRTYVTLPLYHSAGGIIGVGAALTVGGSVFIREKFSAGSFWDDVVDNECTTFQYIGELCRYLVNSAPHPKERQHKLRTICGNGLRPDIWDRFRGRFAIPAILEFYAATEGNAVMMNFDSKSGSIGRIPSWLKSKFNIEVVRYNYDEQQLVRDGSGHCELCNIGEVGELISKIVDDPKRPSQRFEGYADKAATEQKILHDVFEKGDRWFRTGDLVRHDKLGYFYFVDRIGDTFRWKGENVATSEVSETLTGVAGVREVNVYGVTVPGQDGRAGMAALTVDDTFELEIFGKHVTKTLPAYARPLFLRISQDMDLTGTFKLKKINLVKEGFDPANIDDPVYWSRDTGNSYISMDQSNYDEIMTGNASFSRGTGA